MLSYTMSNYQKNGSASHDNRNSNHKVIKDEDVYQLLLQIPEGKTTTYGDLAAALGNPLASRLIGRILGRNPNPISVPCHRVVKSDGTLGGYRGGIDKKIELLKKEGLSINNKSIIDDFENVRFYPKRYE
jgi:methylated-DNA-[protein]-cysteine S-methyltransferase